MAKSGWDLPEWTEGVGGRAAWKKWLNRRVQGCERRARKWAEKQKVNRRLPTRAEWRAAISTAMDQCRGIGHYSGMALSVKPPLKETDWNWPSIDHLSDAGTAEVALETRLVNDMKTIMSEQEFREMVAHLSAVLKVKPNRLAATWKCHRSFAVKQKVDEPPIAVNKSKARSTSR